MSQRSASTAPPLRQMLEGLIAVPSVSSVDPGLDQSNRPVLDLLAGWLEDAGFRIEILPLPSQPKKANLVATLGGYNQGRAGLLASARDNQPPSGLVLSGHADTVPFDEHLWRSDPLHLTEADGRLYGIGTADMKSFLGLAIEAARGFKPADLKHPLILLATADEESAMHGARALVESGRALGRHALIGEPTSLRPVRAHKGVMAEAIRLTGRSGHASDPSLGNNALEGMHEVLSALFAWRDELKRTQRDPAFAIDYPTMNVGHIHGGDNFNRICGHCELHLDIRPLPHQQPEQLRAELRERVAPIAERRALELDIEPLFPSIPPAETAAGAAIVQAAEALTGHHAESASFGTEAPFLNALGMETIVFGPGDIDQAHQPNEYLALDRIAPMLGYLRQLIQRFCVDA
ncbi:acetylornithine deacetylase [Halochromatium salexigens]|uniref:Acetylornithine deacetylase n=1 Tax=Halochromatium salexigens TaxID=49447 RepID=A0AAJ0UJL5_HALSE|nr:acetylornithine deacetylase [Halochromatium salexigens]MBK5931850.1 acetylornithine deacetylase [Halochromatium salexigens]